MSFSFLPVPEHKHPARWWLWIGVSALAVAGLFALVLVMARSPGVKNVPVLARLFHESLVVHVNLSVLVWFVSLAAMGWSLLAHAGGRRSAFLDTLEAGAQLAFALGAFIMALSPLDSTGEALMSNYIPVISNRVFFLGLALLGCGTALAIVHLFLSRPPFRGEEGEGPLRFALAGSAFITALALAAFYWSFRRMPALFDGQQYYDLLFWGGGHILQFTHAQMQMIAWLLLAAAISPGALPRRGLIACFLLGPLVALASFYAYAAYEVSGMEFREFFTRLMRDANGLAPLVVCLLLALGLVKYRSRALNTRALSASLWSSFVLFGFGGALGLMITGQNVVIPAHYHGSIVSVTLALMGLCYLLLPRFGYRDPAGWKLAFWQPVIYAAGQIAHISGLAWSGGYGALRKTPGTDSYPPEAVTAMGLMGGGGLVAVIGGVLFVVVVWKAVRRVPDA